MDDRLNTKESCQYLGVSAVTFLRKINEYNKQSSYDDRIQAIHNNLKSAAKYYKISDLDKLKGFRLA